MIRKKEHSRETDTYLIFKLGLSCQTNTCFKSCKHCDFTHVQLIKSNLVLSETNVIDLRTWVEFQASFHTIVYGLNKTNTYIEKRIYFLFNVVSPE